MPSLASYQVLTPEATSISGDQEIFRQEVLQGLSKIPKALPCKYFYDARGCELFQIISQLPEYYLTRCELEIFQSHHAHLAGVSG